MADEPEEEEKEAPPKAKDLLRPTTNELFDALKERLNSPVVGSFIIIFILFNWESVGLFIFSDVTVKAVDKVLNEADWKTLYYYPPLVTLLYVLVYPWLTFVSNWYKGFVELRNQRYASVVQEGIARERLRQANAIESQRLSIEIQTLSARILELEEQRGEQSRAVAEWSNQLNELKEEESRVEADVTATTKKVEEKKNELAERENDLESIRGGVKLAIADLDLERKKLDSISKKDAEMRNSELKRLTVEQDASVELDDRAFNEKVFAEIVRALRLDDDPILSFTQASLFNQHLSGRDLAASGSFKAGERQALFFLSDALGDGPIRGKRREDFVKLVGELGDESVVRILRFYLALWTLAEKTSRSLLGYDFNVEVKPLVDTLWNILNGWLEGDSPVPYPYQDLFAFLNHIDPVF